MKINQAAAIIAFSVLAGLGLPAAVSATSVREAREDLREARREAREERKNIFEALKDRFTTRKEEAKQLFGWGRVAIGSGVVTAKTDSSLTVEKDGKSYTVNFDAKTQLRRRFWGKSEIDEFSVGNTVNVIGVWTDEAHTTVLAKLVRNLSIQKRYGVFFGEVKSVLGNGWVMSTVSGNRPDQTVTVSSSTKFVNRREETITQAQVLVGHKVRVKGLWDKSLNTITEVKHVKDFSLPPFPTGTAGSPTVTPTATPVSPTATPTATPTVTPTVTATPTPLP